MKPTKIGWCIESTKYKLAFEPPKKLFAPKDQSINRKGYLSCPSVRSYVEDTYVITSPYSIKLRYIEKDEHYEICPVFPFTSIHNSLVNTLVHPEHPSTWRKKNFVTIQIPSPYIFFADEEIFMEQGQPILTDTTKLNWRLIPGKIDIYSWQRPLNWAFEWDISGGDFIIKAGEPIYTLRFFSKSKKPLSVELKEYKMNKKIEDQLELTRGIAQVKTGLNPFFEKAKLKRKKLKLL